MRIYWTVTYISKKMIVWKEKNIEKKVLEIEEYDVNAQYPNKLAIDFTWEKVALLDSIKEWDLVEIMYNTRVNRIPATADKAESIFNSIWWWKITLKESSEEIEQRIKEDSDLPF